MNLSENILKPLRKDCFTGNAKNVDNVHYNSKVTCFFRMSEKSDNLK